MTWQISVYIAVAAFLLCKRGTFLRALAVSTFILAIVEPFLNPVRPWIGFDEARIQMWRMITFCRIAFTFFTVAGAALKLMLPFSKKLANKFGFEEKEGDEDE